MTSPGDSEAVGSGPVHSLPASASASDLRLKSSTKEHLSAARDGELLQLSVDRDPLSPSTSVVHKCRASIGIEIPSRNVGVN